MKRYNLFAQWPQRLAVSLFALGFTLLGGCSSFENQPGQEVTVHVGSESYAFNNVAPEQGLALALLNALISPAQAALISDTYPFLSRVTLGIDAPGYTLATINSEYNGGKFFLTPDGSAIELSETPVTLRVPEGVDITFTVTAYATNGYQYMTGIGVITAQDVASGVGSVAVTMAVDIDPTLPLQASISGCTDTDGDDWCDVYEDLFVTASGSADLDSDGQPNSNDLDADGDGILDALEGNLATNDGFPLFIHANTAPTFVSLPSLVVDEGGSINGTVVVADADLNDSVTLVITTPPLEGNASVTGPTLSYTSLPGFPGSYTIGITATDSQGATATSTVTVVVNNIELPPVVVAEDPPLSVSSVSLLAINPVANDIEYDGQPLSLTAFDAVTTSGGTVSSLGGLNLIYSPPLGFTGSDSFGYTISDGVTPVSGTVAVTVFADADGDGVDDSLEPAQGMDAGQVDSDDDGFSDQHELEARSDPTLAGSTPPGTVISAGNNNNVIATDTLWDLAGSPYWVQSPVTVSSGASLTILPGVAVKVASGITAISAGAGASLYLYGGSSDGLITQIVSDRDDTVQGDTNGDGTATTAVAGDYLSAISDNGGEIEMERIRQAHAVVGVSTIDGIIKIRKSIVSINSTTGLDLDTAAAVIVENSSINANQGGAGIDIKSVGTGSIFKHNLLRGNNGTKGAISIATNTNPLIANNLIVENGGGAAAAGIHLVAGSVSTIEHNTIADNYNNCGGDCGSTAGIWLETGASSTISHNVIYSSGFSYDDIYGDLLSVNSSYNLVNVVNATAGTWGGVGDLVATTPVFLQPWYQFRNPQDGTAPGTSAAVDNGISNSLPLYLAELTAPTTSSLGEVDTSGGDLIDLGFHYDGAPGVLSDPDSEASSDLTDISASSPVAIITVEPRQADGSLLPPGQIVTVDCVITCQGGYFGELVDMGDGSYQVPYYYGPITTPPMTDDMWASVNGTTLTQTVIININ